MTLEHADECLAAAQIFYQECGHPNAEHIELMLADREADKFLMPCAQQAVMVRKYPNVGPWRGGC